MALQVNWSNPDTYVTKTDAYVRVERVVSRVEPKLVIRISVYASLAQYNDGDNAPIDTKKYLLSDTDYTTTYMNGTGINLFAKAYTYLKTLPEFSGAIDV